MNKTRKIYFLAAFVLIIGCYALNKSYSLFVDTQEKEAVSSSVPALVSDISVKNVVLQPYEEIILKETISNSSDVPVSYTLNSSSNLSYTFLNPLIPPYSPVVIILPVSMISGSPRPSSSKSYNS